MYFIFWFYFTGKNAGNFENICLAISKFAILGNASLNLPPWPCCTWDNYARRKLYQTLAVVSICKPHQQTVFRPEVCRRPCCQAFPWSIYEPELKLDSFGCHVNVTMATQQCGRVFPKQGEIFTIGLRGGALSWGCIVFLLHVMRFSRWFVFWLYFPGKAYRITRVMRPSV